MRISRPAIESASAVSFFATRIQCSRVIAMVLNKPQRGGLRCHRITSGLHEREEPLMRTLLLCALLLVSRQVEAQATKADYDRATGRRGQLQGVAINIAERANSIPGTSRFWYRKSVQDGAQ